MRAASTACTESGIAKPGRQLVERPAAVRCASSTPWSMSVRDQLLDEERIALGPLDDQLAHAGREGSAPSSCSSSIAAVCRRAAARAQMASRCAWPAPRPDARRAARAGPWRAASSGPLTSRDECARGGRAASSSAQCRSSIRSTVGRSAAQLLEEARPRRRAAARGRPAGGGPPATSRPSVRPRICASPEPLERSRPADRSRGSRSAPCRTSAERPVGDAAARTRGSVRCGAAARATRPASHVPELARRAASCRPRHRRRS